MTTKKTLLDKAEAAARDCPWTGSGPRVADYVAATLRGDSEALADHQAAAEARDQWANYNVRSTLTTAAKVAAGDVQVAAREGKATEAEFRELVTKSVSAQLVAQEANRHLAHLRKPAWYIEPTERLDHRVQIRRLRTAKTMEPLLVDARLAVSKHEMEPAVILGTGTDAVSLSALSQWVTPLVKLREERNRLLAETPRSGESEADRAHRLAPRLDALTQQIDGDDDLLAPTHRSHA